MEGYFHELDRKDIETAEELELTVQVIREKLSLSEKRAVSECMGLKELFYYCMVYTLQGQNVHFFIGKGYSLRVRRKLSVPSMKKIKNEAMNGSK